MKNIKRGSRRKMQRFAQGRGSLNRAEHPQKRDNIFFFFFPLFIEKAKKLRHPSRVTPNAAHQGAKSRSFLFTLRTRATSEAGSGFARKIQ